jgi:hypothetical protein
MNDSALHATLYVHNIRFKHSSMHASTCSHLITATRRTIILLKNIDTMLQ